MIGSKEECMSKVRRAQIPMDEVRHQISCINLLLLPHIFLNIDLSFFLPQILNLIIYLNEILEESSGIKNIVASSYHLM